MRWRLCLAIALTLALTLVISCSDGFPPEFPAPDFSLKAPQTGKTVSLSDLKGNPAIVYWFASW